ncbi:reverse transcriptase domain-containing protein [Escherichia marmotae]|uniref:reverse transcriptase domain-containing protein n=1 Tax=Escherichia marmotae TaxID=1499973 RepID=UPI002F3270AD
MSWKCAESSPGGIVPVICGFDIQEDIYYVRYMDDFLFLSTRRWPLRRAIRQLHVYFENTGFECHPDKIQVGRTERGFDWLGVWFDATGLAGIAPRAKENHRARRLRLEEGAGSQKRTV